MYAVAGWVVVVSLVCLAVVVASLAGVVLPAGCVSGIGSDALYQSLY